jgi:hypothetical protein
MPVIRQDNVYKVELYTEGYKTVWMAVDKLYFTLHGISGVDKTKNPLDLYTSYPHTVSKHKTRDLSGLKHHIESYAHIHNPY